jgi:hypothetical protein
VGAVHGFVYFKAGLCRDELEQPMTIDVDEKRNRQAETLMAASISAACQGCYG